MRARPLAVLVLLPLLAASSATAQQVHKFPDHGFRISAPSGWTVIPPRPGEQWILARFLSDREYQCKDTANSSFQSTHRPWLRVIGFPKRDSRAEVTVIEETSTRKSAFVTFPYRDYDDYLKRHDHGGGFFVASTENIIIGGIPVTRQEVKIEKMATVPRRLLACIYHFPDRELAVEAEVTEQQLPALGEELGKALKSLVITGEAKKPESAASRPDMPIIGVNPKDMAKKRDERRRAWHERALVDVQKNLPKGWTARKTKYFLVLNHASDKYAELLIWQANEVREWLDANLKNVGDGELMRPILRICASDDEARAYASGSGDSFVWSTGEVVCAERGGYILDDFSTIAAALLDQYLADRHPALETALPQWIQTGLRAYIRGARISKKQGGLVFPPPFGAYRTGMKMIQENRFIPINELVRKEPDGFGPGQKGWDASDFAAESELFVRWLLFGSGRTGFTKGLVQRYMQGTVQQLEAMDVDLAKKAAETRAAAPRTEAEEEADFKRRRAEGQEFATKHRMERQRVLDELTGIVLKDWKPEDWTRVDKAFKTWLEMGGGR
jgi:hypothetical protein